jgi:adenylate cyclase
MSTSRELAESIAAYVPADVVHRVLRAERETRDVSRPGEIIPIEAAVLFADVAGFTPLSERMSLLGPLGAESLALMLNETFATLIAQIELQGGMVARFGGDALTAFFARTSALTAQETVTRALACAQAMQHAMATLAYIEVSDQVFRLSIKIGAAYGPAALLVVGDVARGLERVLAGPAVDLAVNGEHHARAGEIAAHSAMLSLAAGALACEPLERRDDYGLVPSSPLISIPLVPFADAKKRPSYPDLASDEARLAYFVKVCSPYLPRSIYARLVSGQGDFAGEHRRVTSMFVRFAGICYEHSDSGSQLQAYFRAMQDVVARFEGHLNRVLTGDKGSVLHILFGAPDAHEDDVFRALRCALALQAEVAKLPFEVEQRIGIASGIVFAGPIGSLTRREYTVIGDTVILSWRFATAACAPDSIMVDAYTRDRTAQRFEYQALPPVQVKGKAEPVHAFRLMAERATEAGLAARYLSSRWILVGRERERADLLRATDCALAGHGCTVAVSGRAGVGKTRLVEEVVRHWLLAGGNGYSGECLSHGLNVPYLPWDGFLSAFFGFRDSDSPEDRWRKVETTLAEESPASLPWAGAIALLLGLPGLTAPMALLDAAERRRKLFEVVAELLRARASRTPLLVLFEDIHWADQSSLDLLDYVAARTHDVPLLLCLSFRTPPDVNLVALKSPNCTWKVLDELAPASADALVCTILGTSDLEPEMIQLVQEIRDKALGNPLFVEEILNSLIDNGVLVRENDRYRLVGDASQVEVPDSLQSLLMARLDKLEPPSRDLTQVASVIGQRFAYNILRGVYPYRMSDTAMRERLDNLVHVDLTRLERPDPELAYLFRHALTYEVVYNCLPFARRRELHARVGDFLELLYQDQLEEVSGMLARHFAEAQKWDKAVVVALMAGTQAQELYANQDALAYFRLAERCLEHLSPDDFWISAVRLHLNRGRLYRLLGQYDVAEVDLQHAIEIARRHDDLHAQAEAYNVLAESYWWQSRNEDLLDAANNAYDLSRRCGHAAELAVSTHTMGLAYQALGDWPRAREYFDKAYQLAKDQSDEPLRAAVLSDLGTLQAFMGDLDDALERFQQALEIRQKIGLKDKMASTMVNLAIIQHRRGDTQNALKVIRRSIVLAREIDSGALPYSLLTQAEMEAFLGRYDAARQLLEESQQIFAERNDAVGLGWVKLGLACDVYFELEQYDLTWTALEDALPVMRSISSYEEVIRALKTLGAVALRTGDTAAARRYLDEAQLESAGHSLAWPLAEALVWQARVALAEGRHADAEAFACAALDAINQRSCADWRAPAYDVLAKLAQGRGDQESFTQHMTQAVKCAQERCRHSECMEILDRYQTLVPERSAGESAGVSNIMSEMSDAQL